MKTNNMKEQRPMKILDGKGKFIEQKNLKIKEMIISGFPKVSG